MYASNDISDINKNILMLTLGPQCKERESSRIATKQIQVKPEVNRGWQATVNHSKADCVGNTAGQLGTSTLCSAVAVQPDNEKIVKPTHC